jgi:methyl-accepting chemotaxis protein
MFSNVTIKINISLLIGFFLIALCGVGWLGLDSLSDARKGLSSVYRDQVVPLKQLKGIADNYAVLVIDAVNKANAGIFSAEDALASIRAARNKTDMLWKAYMATELTDKEAGLADEAGNLIKQANADVDKVSLFLSSKQGMIGDGLSEFDGPLYATIDPISDKIAELVGLQLEVAGQAYETQAAHYETTFKLVLGVILLSLVISLAFGVWIVRSILSQLGGEPAYTAAMMRQISCGNTSVEIDTRPNDNSSLLAAMRDLVKGLQRFIADMNYMSMKHEEGEIDVKMDADKFEGDFKTMVQGVNTMVGGHIAVKKALDCVKAFGEGDLDAPLEQLPGKKAYINDTIEQLHGNLPEQHCE